MPDREKVIKGLNHCKTTWMCNGCPYEDDVTDECPMFDDALALLREQEPVKTEPVRFRVVRAGVSNYPFWDCVCDGCGYKTSMVHTDWKYCPMCGLEVKWDADG